MTGATTALLVLLAAAGAPRADPRTAAPPAEQRPPSGGPDSRAIHAAALDAALRRFEATDLTGRRWTRADLRGRVVLLDFWATWCAPCLADLPHLAALHARHSRERFEILGISLDVSSRRAFVSWLNRHRIAWPQVHERSGYASGVARQFGIDRLPRTVVLAADGLPVAVDVRGAELVALVDELVACGGRCPGRGAAPR